MFNVDAATSNMDQLIRLRVVIKDSNGKIVATGIKQAHPKENVSSVQVEAVDWGLPVARIATLSSLITETDCQEVAEFVNSIKGSRTFIYWIIAEIQN